MYLIKRDLCNFASITFYHLNETIVVKCTFSAISKEVILCMNELNRVILITPHLTYQNDAWHTRTIKNVCRKGNNRVYEIVFYQIST